ncbi:glycoside hydrolase family 2 TIM barrel-domain containing protein [Sodalis sp.]
MVQCNHYHASIIIWSLDNESGQDRSVAAGTRGLAGNGS